MDKNQLFLIPTPKKVSDACALSPFLPAIDCSCADWAPLVEVTATAFLKIFGQPLPCGKGGLRLVCDPSIPCGAYRLHCQTEVTLYAADSEGARYGLATFLQLVQQKDDSLFMPQVEITDHADKPHRGFMVDLARWWHPKKRILAYLDLCFFYKIKYMHLHFVDNQSYTLPSRVLPKLPTENRHYSFEDIAEICAYAEARGVELIPELEMPGHAKQLNVFYPEIFSDQTSDGYIQNIGRTPTVVCAGSPQAFDALTALIDEVMEMFPRSQYIHVGGDEATIEHWAHCDICQGYMQEKGLRSAKELYSEFTARITDYVLSKGRTPIVWEGFPKEAAHLISKQVLVMAWECYYNQPEDLLADGFTVINCAWKPLYICPGYTDWTYKDLLHWNVYNLQNFSEKSRATKTPVQLSPTPQVAGAQLCAWEACYEYEIHPVVEFMAAFCERTWAADTPCDDTAFDAALTVQRAKAFRLITEG